jgi:hypothetical protein
MHKQLTTDHMGPLPANAFSQYTSGPYSPNSLLVKTAVVRKCAFTDTRLTPMDKWPPAWVRRHQPAMATHLWRPPPNNVGGQADFVCVITMCSCTRRQRAHDGGEQCISVATEHNALRWHGTRLHRATVACTHRSHDARSCCRRPNDARRYSRAMFVRCINRVQTCCFAQSVRRTCTRVRIHTTDANNSSVRPSTTRICSDLGIW